MRAPFSRRSLVCRGARPVDGVKLVARVRDRGVRMNTTRTLRTGIVAASIVMLGGGCGPAVDEPDPPIVRAEHRVDPCRTYCSSVLDSECGSTRHPRQPIYENVDACIDQCADEEGGWHWGLQPDGTDACEDAWSDYAACLAGLSCEDQRLHWDSPPTSDFPCKSEQFDHASCGAENPPPQEGES